MNHSLPVRLAAMSDMKNNDQFSRVINGVENPVIADAKAKLIFSAFEFSRLWRAGLIGQFQYFIYNDRYHLPG